MLVFHGGYHGVSSLLDRRGPVECAVPVRGRAVATSRDDVADRGARPGSRRRPGRADARLGRLHPRRAGLPSGVFNAARAAGAVCIADEDDLTRPLGSHRAAGRRSDIRTYGKYIGGGFSFGAFGGTAELLDQFDSSRPGSIPHAGTFNNNVATMAAGCVALGELYTADTAEVHTARGERFRASVAEVIGRHRLPVSVSGYGSMLALHALPAAPVDGAQSAQRDTALQELLFLGLYLRGIYTARADGQPEPAADGCAARPGPGGTRRHARRPDRTDRIAHGGMSPHPGGGLSREAGSRLLRRHLGGEHRLEGDLHASTRDAARRVRPAALSRVARDRDLRAQAWPRCATGPTSSTSWSPARGTSCTSLPASAPAVQPVGRHRPAVIARTDPNEQESVILLDGQDTPGSS